MNVCVLKLGSDNVESLLHGLSISKEVSGCLSCLEADFCHAFGHQSYQLCWVSLDVTPLPTLIVVIARSGFFMNDGHP